MVPAVDAHPAPVPPEALVSALREGVAALGLTLTPAQESQLLAYLEAILDWNTRLNLTAVRDPLAAVERHLLDSLSVVPAWAALRGDEPPARFLDVGTGGGFPGAPLAVAWPAAEGLLIDGTGKKVRAVADALARAGIGNAEALQCRGHLLPRERPSTIRSFDLCVARAVGRAATLLREVAPLAAPGGLVLLMKGPEPPADEVEEAHQAARECGLAFAGTHPSGVPGRDRGAILAYRADAVRPVRRPRGAERRADRRAPPGGSPGDRRGGPRRGRRR